jgi:hypothetical protein
LVAVFISDAGQQKTPLTAINGYLSDDFVETLIEEFLSYGTETDLAGLPVDESFIEFLVQLDDFYFGGGCGEDSLNPKLPIVSAMLLRGEYLSQNILSVMQFFVLFGLLVLTAFGSTQKDGGRIFYEGGLLSQHYL